LSSRWRWPGEPRGQARRSPHGWASRADAAVITALDSVAWLLNIRGADVDRTPVALSFVIAHADGTADLVHRARKGHARGARPSGQCRARLPREVSHLADRAGGQAVAVDPERAWRRSSPRWLAGARLSRRDPCVLPKAVKNPVEQAGTARPRPATGGGHALPPLAER
jgi:Xaa-Pro aminopeptidase